MPAATHRPPMMHLGFALLVVPLGLGLAVTALLSFAQRGSLLFDELVVTSGKDSSGFATAASSRTERPLVGTLTDMDASRVNLIPKRASVRELINLRRPASLPQDIEERRIAPAELTTYVVHALAVQITPDPSGDTRLIVADPDDLSKTMVTEFVYWRSSGSQLGNGNANTQTFKIAFAQLHSLFGDKVSPETKVKGETFSLMDWYPDLLVVADRQHFRSRARPPSDLIESALIEITGVGFFASLDRKKPGSASNGIELRPVLSVRHLPFTGKQSRR